MTFCSVLTYFFCFLDILRKGPSLLVNDPQNTAKAIDFFETKPEFDVLYIAERFHTLLTKNLEQLSRAYDMAYGNQCCLYLPLGAEISEWSEFTWDLSTWG